MIADQAPATTGTGTTGTSEPAASGTLRWRLTAQALSGSAFLLLISLGSLWLLLAALGWVEGGNWLLPRVALALAAGLVAVHVLRWLWVPQPKPVGIPVTQSEAPDLHATLTDLRERFSIRQPIEVCITGEMNASIVSHPRRLTLLIGLPLLLGVTPKQCDAILSHEFGHLVLQRAGPGRWANHVHAWWYRVLDRIDRDESLLGRLVSRLLGAADRRYLEDGLRLSRAEEFQADALAQRAVGAQPLAEALTAIALKEHFLTRDFLPKIHDQAAYRQQPVMLPYRQMASALRVGYDSDKSLADYASLVEEDTPTHPSIRSRVARLSNAPWPIYKQARSAAEAYLGSAMPRLTHTLDQAWWNVHGHDWTRQHREAQWARRRISLLIERGPEQHPLRRMELARLVETYWPAWDPLELYVDLLEEESVQYQALLAVGRLLLDQGNADGATYLKMLLDHDSEAGMAAASRLAAFAASTGQEELARQAEARVELLRRQARLIEHETMVDPLGKCWQSPGLDPIVRYRLAKVIAQHPGVRRAYVVQRISRRTPHWQIHVIVLRTDTTTAAMLNEIHAEAQAVMHERALVCLLPVSARSPYERTAADAGRTRLHLRRKSPVLNGEPAVKELHNPFQKVS